MLTASIAPNEPFPTDLETPSERAAWLMGHLLEAAPSMARPIIRSMLLPKLEQLDEGSLIETLVLIKDQVLPWVLSGDVGVDPEAGFHDQSGREDAVRGADGVWQDDPG